MEKKVRTGIWRLIGCIIISIICISLFSKSSPLYPINDWVDAQCFFTVGKAMMKGMVPYRDLMEQKGPLLYLIYGIASLISYNSFLGVYLIEIVAFVIYLYFIIKIWALFGSEGNNLLWTGVYAVLFCVTSAFSQGGVRGTLHADVCGRHVSNA